MSLRMTRKEREAYLAEVHVGVISIERPERAPLSVPIWYDYSPDAGLWVLTGKDSQKGRALRAAMRFTVCAQTETPPAYRYVSVEGAVTQAALADHEAHRRPMAHRYFGPELGDRYLESTDDSSSWIFRMQPERWLTVDYGKLQAT